VIDLQKDREVGKAYPLVYALVSTGRQDRIIRGAVASDQYECDEKATKNATLARPSHDEKQKSKIKREKEVAERTPSEMPHVLM